jgi:hypothetical protein
MSSCQGSCPARHQELAAGQWSRLSLAEHLGTERTEVGRMRQWRGKDERLAAGAEKLLRALAAINPDDPALAAPRRMQ